MQRRQSARAFNAYKIKLATSIITTRINIMGIFIEGQWVLCWGSTYFSSGNQLN
jgi:hypothetical protein